MKRKFLLTTLSMMFICVLGFFSEASAQHAVSGKVSGEDGSALPGANIMLKGSTTGTVTDVDGRFSINVPDPANSVLIISSIGLKTQEVRVNGRSVIDITLVEDVTALNEVVVTAFGLEREKKALGYSVQEVRGEEFTEAREVNIANSLQGKVAGVNITRSTGGSSNVVIRGNSSLQGNNQPLYVVDGVPIDNQQLGAGAMGGAKDFGDGIGSINPDDVESMSVLKGPAAAALYGARGANGVILITTKKGRKKKGVGVSVNSNTVFEEINVLPIVQNKYGGGYDDNYEHLNRVTIDGEEYLQYPNWMMDQWGGEMDGRLIHIQNMPHLGLVPYSPQPLSNIRDFYETGKTFTNTVSVDGSNGKTSFIASFGNMIQSGIMPNNSRDRNTFNVKVNSEVTERLTVEAKVNYVRENWKNVPLQGTNLQSASNALFLMPRFISLDMLQPYKTPEGRLNQWRPNGPHNPYWSVNEIQNEQNRDRMMGYMLAKYKFTNWLSLQARTGTDFYTQKRLDTRGSGIPGANINGEMTTEQWNFKEENTDILLTASNRLSENFSGSLTLGAQHLNRSQERVGLTGTNLDIPDFFHINNARTVTPGYSLIRRQMNSVFMLGQIGYKDVLFLDFTGRNDWSSTLGPNTRSFFYPSVSTSFAFTEALKLDSKLLTFGKVRASYAQAGNDAAPYQTRGGFSTSTQSFGSNGYLSVPSRVPLTDLRNELTSSIEIGADIRLFNNRLGIDFTYYEQSTTNQIIPISISPTSGYTERMINAGEIQNKGIELMVNANVVKAGAFRWDMMVNGSRNKSMVVELAPDIETHTIHGTALFGGIIEARPGERFGNITGFRYLTNENGDRLLNSNGEYQRTGEREVLGNIQPDFVGGFSNTLSYKGFVASALVDFSIGGQMLSGTKGETYSRGTHIDTENRTNLIADGVIDNGDGTFRKSDIVLTGQQYYATHAWSQITETFVVNADFATLREVTLGYNFNPALLSKTPFTSAKVSLVGRNLLYLYRDPEVRKMGIAPEGRFNTSMAAQGIEARTMPPTRSIGFNLAFSF